MKTFVRALFFSFLFFSCTDTPVDLFATSVFIPSQAQFLMASSISAISNNPNPQIEVIKAVNDPSVHRLALFSSSFCDSSSSVGEVGNEVGVKIISSAFSEGTFQLYYRPVFSPAAGATSIAPCIFSGVTYTYDRTPPMAPVLDNFSVTESSSSVFTIGVSGCETTGFAQMIFKESSVAPSGGEIGWETCGAVKLYQFSTERYGTKTIYAFFKDQAGNISAASNLLTYQFVTPALNFVGSTNLVIYRGYNTIAINFEANGSISNCAFDPLGPSLPQGLVLDPNSCQITGIPLVSSSMINYIVRAQVSGVYVSTSFSMAVNDAVQVTNTNGSGPEAPHLTKYFANVSGQSPATHYKFAFNPMSETNCETANYSAAINFNQGIEVDFQNMPDYTTIRICVIGWSSAAQQAVNTAHTIFWTKKPTYQNLWLSSDTSDRQIRIGYVKKQSEQMYTVTRKFIIGVEGEVVCANCTVKKTSESEFVTSGNFKSNDVIQFRILNPDGDDDQLGASFKIDNGELEKFYSIQIKTAPPRCNASAKRAFLTKQEFNGNMGGIAGANTICQNAAGSLGGTWKALLNTSSQLVLSLMESDLYCDSVTQIPIVREVINVKYFSNSFTKFVDGTPTNGGGAEFWKYIAGAVPRFRSTEIWLGEQTGCNCNNWSSSLETTCSSAYQIRGGRSTHEAPTDWPSQGLQNPTYFDSCNEKRHLICYEM